MIKNYLKVAFRSFSKNKLSAFVNIFGLTLGISTCLLILQYVSYEHSFDDFQKSNVFRLALIEGVGTPVEDLSAPNYYGAGEDVTAQIPEIENFCTLHENSATVSYQNNVFNEEGIFYVDTSFLNVFSYPLIQGDQKTALSHPNNLVITPQIAKKYFGDQDPIGKILLLDGKENFTVTGLIESPTNSHFKFDILRNNANLIEDPYRKHDGIWNWSNFYVYLKLTKDADPGEAESKIAEVLSVRREPLDPEWEHILQPIDDIYLHSDLSWEMGATGHGNIIKALFIIALIILCIGWINMINLSTAHATEYAKEVGIRKVSGASQLQLIGQYMTQSFVMNLLALLLSLVTCYLAHPFFENLVGTKITPFWQMSASTYLAAVSIFFFGVALSGFYPALILSKYNPIKTLKGNYHTSNSGLLLRKSLTIFQFASSIILIAVTLMIYKQIQFMRTQDLGFSPERVLALRTPKVFEDSQDNKFESFMHALENLPFVQQVSNSSTVPSQGISGSWNGFRRQDQGLEQGIMMHVSYTDNNFIDTYQIPLERGRSFMPSSLADSNAILLNTSGALALGYNSVDDAIGKIVKIGENNRSYNIVGVVSDYHRKSLKEKINPQVIFNTSTFPGFFSIRLLTSDIQNNISEIESRYHAFFPNNAFDYFFVDQAFNQQYQADLKLGRSITIFALIAIFIACLGLFALITFSTMKMAKQIGIRKVLGASKTHIVSLVAKDFIMVFPIAIMLSIPVSYYAISQWLQKFPYQTGLNWWVFLVAPTIALLIALLTMMHRGFAAAAADPIKAIRDE